MLTLIALCDCSRAPDTGRPCDWIEPLPDLASVHVGGLLQVPSPAAVTAHLRRRGWAVEPTDDGPTLSLCPVCSQGRGGAA